MQHQQPSEAELRAASGASASGPTPDGDGEGTWEVYWCYDGWHPAADALELLLKERAPWAVLRRLKDGQRLRDVVSAATHILIPTTGMVTREDMDACPNLRLVAQPAAGYNNIDVKAAQERGIPVTIAPGLNSHSVAEVALMMILMINRRAVEAMAAFRRQERIGEPVGHELFGKQLGIIGMGKVGQCLAAAAEGLGMKVVGTTSKSSRTELEALLSGSHVVSIHCPLNDATRGLIGPAELALMRRGAVLVNCARGGVVQKAALLEALRGGGLGGVGLDTHWLEPAPVDDELYRDPRVLSLPHLGSISAEVYDRFADILAENIVRVREGGELLNRLA